MLCNIAFDERNKQTQVCEMDVYVIYSPDCYERTKWELELL